MNTALITTEKTILGTVLYNPEALQRIGGTIRPEDFFLPEHQELWKVISSLRVQMKDVNVLSVANVMGRNKSDYDPSYLDELVTYYHVDVESALTLASQLVEESGRRTLGREIEILSSEIKKDTSFGELLSHLNGITAKLAAKSFAPTELFGKALEDSFINMLDTVKSDYNFIGIPEIDSKIYDFNPGEVIIVAARPGVGKALPSSFPTLTPEGWVPHDSLKVGDKVYGKDGNTYNVIGVFPQGERDIYKVSFNDGTYTLCDLEHLWYTESRTEYKRKGIKGSVKTTKEILETIRVDRGSRYNHKIPLCEPINFPEAELLIDPYKLGILLGDGCRVSSVDEEILGVFAGKHRYADNVNSVVTISTGLTKELKSLGIYGLRSWEKYIPGVYLRGSIQQREALLQGLMDADGYARGGSTCFFTSTSEKLAHGVLYLVRSLGGVGSISQKQKSFKGKPGLPSWEVTFRMTSKVTPFRLERKLKKWKATRFNYKYITDVEFSHREEANCIAVDAPDHLYVVQDFVVTHNTASLLQSARVQIQAGKTVGFLTLEMPESKLLQRLISAKSGVNGNEIARMSSSDFMENEELVEALLFYTQNEQLIIDTGAPYDIDTIERVMRKMKYVHGVDVIYIDYIQLIGGSKSEKNENRQQQLSTISRRLKNLSAELNVRLVVAAQLNREAARRGTGPVLSDLRDSGALEQDASIIIFLYPYFPPTLSEEQQEEMVQRSEVVNVKFEIAKQRNGPVWTFDLQFVKAIGVFRTKDEGFMTDFQNTDTEY